MYAIRSYAYILLHLLPVRIVSTFSSPDKVRKPTSFSDKLIAFYVLFVTVHLAYLVYFVIVFGVVSLNGFYSTLILPAYGISQSVISRLDLIKEQCEISLQNEPLFIQ